jgi:hypothetical protein
MDDQVSVTRGGKTYTATYKLEDELVFVSCWPLGTNATQLGGLTPQAVGRHLLTELVQGHEEKKN